MLQQLWETVRDSMSFCGCAASDQLVTLEINRNCTPNLYITNMQSPQKHHVGLVFQK